MRVEPEYCAMDGFVMAPDSRALVVTWVRADSLWFVDAPQKRSTLTEYNDAIQYARAHSVIAAPDPTGRLRRLADYLDLPWPWLPRRCGQLGQVGGRGTAAAT